MITKYTKAINVQANALKFMSMTCKFSEILLQTSKRVVEIGLWT